MRAGSLALAVAAFTAALAAAPARAELSLVAQAERKLRQAEHERDAPARFKLADEAARLCAEAERRTPADPLPHLTLARALATTDPAHPEGCRPGACERATEELLRARALDGSGVESERIASELGIVLSRRGAFAEALVEYQRALRRVDSERLFNSLEDLGGRAVLLGNSAESLMALGRLDEAIARYREAEAAASPGDLYWQLAEWGLGVALDRDEQGEKAQLAIQRALDYDPTMAHLTEEGVFFEPAGDTYYYLALGHEVAGDRVEALAAWRDYIAAQPNSPWAGRVRRHVEALRRVVAGGSDGAPRVRVGEPRWQRQLPLRSEIKAEIARREPDLRLCYARALRDRPHAQGELQLALEITPGGRVRAAGILPGDDPWAPIALERCLERAASAWRFAQAEGSDVEDVVVPLVFDVGPR
jgi:tetratricopeptide (TPR) repeat protein